MAWENTLSRGLRQTDNGTDFAPVPGANYTTTKTQRVADLTMDTHGEVTGQILMTYIGSSALRWRHRALSGDEESLKTGLRTNLEEMLPKTLEVKVSSIENLTDYEKPLVVHYEVKGAFGTPTGKRLILPADVFLVEDVSTFPHEKREEPVYFQYPQTVADAMRIKFPATMSIEALPTETKLKFLDAAQYTLSAKTAPGSFTVQRNALFNLVIVPVKDYGELRSFYTQMETKDKDSVVLKMNAESASTGTPGGN